MIDSLSKVGYEQNVTDVGGVKVELIHLSDSYRKKPVHKNLKF